MTSKVQFDVYYGAGTVLYGPTGVNLSGFKCIKSKIADPQERTFASVYRWLERGFHIDSETTMLTVQAVINRVHGGEMWELQLIRNTNQ